MTLAALAMLASMMTERPVMHALRTELHRAELAAWSDYKARADGYVACVACEKSKAP